MPAKKAKNLPFDLAFHGPPAAGKGTQTRALAGIFGLATFDTGAALRAEIAAKSPVGIEIDAIIQAGAQVPAGIPLDLFEKFFQNLPAGQKILADGLVRNQGQLDGFTEKMAKNGRDWRMILIRVPREVALERIRARAEIEGRVDDLNENSLKNRWDLWEKFLAEIAPQIRAAGRLVEVDGDALPEVVTERILAAIEAEIFAGK